MARRSLLAAFSVFTAIACASRFDPASKIASLRVLAVQKDKPYARPGDTVRLSMRLASGAAGTEAGASRPINIYWLTGCENPNADSYFNCFTDLGDVGITDLLAKFHVSQGLETSVTLSNDITSRRPPPANPDQPRNGSAFVFFVACGGDLK